MERAWTQEMLDVWAFYGGDVTEMRRVYRQIYDGRRNPTTADWMHANKIGLVLRWITTYGDPAAAAAS